MSYHHSCDFGYMAINSAARFKIKYCGIHSEMTIFPPNINVTIDFIVGRNTKFSTIFFHSIIDPSNVITITSLTHDHSNINRWTLYFLKTHLYLQKFILRVHSYQYLVIKCHWLQKFFSENSRWTRLHVSISSTIFFSRQWNNPSPYQSSALSNIIISVCYLLYHFNASFINKIFKYSSNKIKSGQNVLISPFKNASHSYFQIINIVLIKMFA